MARSCIRRPAPAPSKPYRSEVAHAHERTTRATPQGQTSPLFCDSPLAQTPSSPSLPSYYLSPAGTMHGPA
eukprot:3007177-Prymnesium_polylepis.1